MQPKLIQNVLYALVVIIQLAALVSLGSQKQGFHIDEIYSYQISNSYHAEKVTGYDGLWDQWVPGNSLLDLITVQEGEQFAYPVVYHNNAVDCHPPLFYFLLHSICSLFPGTFTKWYGLVLNICFFVATQVVIYSFAKEILGSSFWAVLPVAVYGGMRGALSCTIFIRMYTVLSFFTIALIWRLVHLIQKNKGAFSDYLSLFVVTYLGSFTQYYFAIPAFFATLFTVIVLAGQRRWNDFFGAGLGVLFGIVCMFATYPAAFTQIGGSSTNNVGNNVMANILNFDVWVGQLVAFAKLCFRGCLYGFRWAKPPVSIILLSTIGATAYIQSKHRHEMVQEDAEIGRAGSLSLAGILVVAFSIVVIARISGTFAFERYIYHLYPLLALAGALLVYYTVKRACIWDKGVCLGCIAIWLVATVTMAQHANVTTTFNDLAESETRCAAVVNNRPTIAVLNRSNPLVTEHLLTLAQATDIYLDTGYESLDLDEIVSTIDSSNGVALYVEEQGYWMRGIGMSPDDAVRQVVSSTDCFSSYEDIGSCSFGHVYLLW